MSWFGPPEPVGDCDCCICGYCDGEAIRGPFASIFNKLILSITTDTYDETVSSSSSCIGDTSARYQISGLQNFHGTFIRYYEIGSQPAIGATGCHDSETLRKSCPCRFNLGNVFAIDDLVATITTSGGSNTETIDYATVRIEHDFSDPTGEDGDHSWSTRPLIDSFGWLLELTPKVEDEAFPGLISPHDNLYCLIKNARNSLPASHSGDVLLFHSCQDPAEKIKIGTWEFSFGITEP